VEAVVIRFEYLGGSETNLDGIVQIAEFEDQLRNACGTDKVTQISVRSLVPGLSGAAVFLIHRIGELGQQYWPWVVKAASDLNLIISERENYKLFVKGILQNAPDLILDQSSKLFIMSFGGLSNNTQSLRVGYEQSSTTALNTLAHRIVTALAPIHTMHADTASCIERMPALLGLKDKLLSSNPRVDKQLIENLCKTWDALLKAPDRYPHRRSRAHGDLNAGNVLFEPGPEASYPVFIDFASMQRSKDNEAYPLGFHLPFWDYAKLERDIQTRMFLKEAINRKVPPQSIMAAIQTLNGGSEHRQYSQTESTKKLTEITTALRKNVIEAYAPDTFRRCYRTVLAYAMLSVLLRKQPDEDVELDLQYQVAVQAAMALLSSPFSDFSAANEVVSPEPHKKRSPGREDDGQVDRVGDHVMTFNHTTKVDNTCIERLINSKESVEINYYEDIATKMDTLEKRYRFPIEFINQHPVFRDEKLQERKESVGAGIRALLSDHWVRCRDIKDQNENAFMMLRQRLARSQVPNDLAARSVSTFGAFAALRLIRELKDGYDIKKNKDDLNTKWFSDWKFGRYTLFDLVPDPSDSGDTALGYRYFVLARVGIKPDYSNFTIPFVIGRRLLLSEAKGDREAYWIWVLPQMLVRGEHQLDETFPVDTWEVDRLVGAGSTEWHGDFERCPWDLNTYYLERDGNRVTDA
jgi:hypothetical protein